MPIPSDLLVSFYFPFSSGGFKEYSPWVPNKAQVADDALRQQYPWKLFVSEQLKKGELPLWSPYAFSGYPLLANIQSAVFYPPNLLFIFLNPKTAWTILIMIQPILSSLFMYLFLRSLKLSKPGAMLGALIFVGMTFELFWLEQMIIGHTTLWLPLVLLSIQRVFEGRKKWLIFGLLGLILSLLGGYSQTSLYVYLISFSFLIYKTFSLKNKKEKINLLFPGILMFGFSLGICALQLFPTAEVYKYSAREGVFSEKLYGESLAPPRNILTVLTADFFGSMATHNYWGDQHTDFNHYFGSIPLLIILTGLLMAYKKKLSLREGKFFLILGLTAWLFALQTPFGYLPLVFKIPILSTGVVARFLFVFQFCMAIVAAYCLDLILAKREFKIPLKPGLFLLVLTIFLSFLLFYLSKTDPIINHQKAFFVGFRNIIFASGIYFFGLTILFLSRFNNFKKYAIIALLLLTSFEFIYLSNKYLPVAKKEYLFPEHPLFTFLQKKAGIDRVWGQETTYLTTNFPTVYSLQYSDGYDSLFIKRYGELIYSARAGEIPTTISRSDVNLSPNKEDWIYKERMLDILGIKYVLDKNDIPKESFEPEPWKFSPYRYKLIWQNGKFKVYENLKAWPRIYFASNIIVKTDNQDIINYLLQKKENNLAVVEENIPGNISTGGKGIIKLIKYEAGKIDIKTQTSNNSFLVLSDNYYPGWKAKIDGNNTNIYRTNYTFRGIVVPKGEHKIEFSYEPNSLKVGIMISLFFIFLTIISFCLPFLLRFKAHKSEKTD